MFHVKQNTDETINIWYNINEGEKMEISIYIDRDWAENKNIFLLFKKLRKLSIDRSLEIKKIATFKYNAKNIEKIINNKEENKIIISEKNKYIAKAKANSSHFENYTDKNTIFLDENLINLNEEFLKLDKNSYPESYKFFGISKRDLREKLISDFKKYNILVKIKGFKLNGELILTIKFKNDSYLKTDLSFIDDLFASKYKEYYIGKNYKSAEESLFSEIKKRNLNLITGESITGGLVAAKFINNKGASNYLKESFIVYSNEAKMKTLGVRKNTLDKYTAVSSQTLIEMLKGLERKDTLAIATSGYADGEKDICGIVYFGAYYNGRFRLVRKRYRGKRNEVRENASKDALLNAYILLKSL